MTPISTSVFAEESGFHVHRSKLEFLYSKSSATRHDRYPFVPSSSHVDPRQDALPVSPLTRFEPMLIGITATSSREQQSTTFSRRNGRPSNRTSDMKSMAHTSLGAAIAGRPVR